MIFLMQPFSAKAEDAPTELQLELINLQCSNFIKIRFDEMPLIDFLPKVCALTTFSKAKESSSMANFTILQHAPLQTIIFSHEKY